MIIYKQTERETYGRQYSDNESEEEEFYDQESSLMGMTRALPPRAHTVATMGAASAPPAASSIPKVRLSVQTYMHIVFVALTSMFMYAQCLGLV